MNPEPSDRAAGLREGKRRRDAAHKLLVARRRVYVQRAKHAFLKKLLDGSPTATADDVRFAVELPTGIDPRLFGPVPRSLALAGIVRRCGYRNSCRPERHASVIGVWELVDHTAAMAWLVANPEPQDVAAEPGDDLPLWQSVNEKRPTVAAVERDSKSPSNSKGNLNG